MWTWHPVTMVLYFTVLYVSIGRQTYRQTVDPHARAHAHPFRLDDGSVIVPERIGKYLSVM